MKSTTLKLYEKPQPFGALKLWFNTIVQTKPLRKVSANNRYNDYQNLLKSPELLPLHHQINSIILQQTESYDGYDYGEGYFYQSYAPVGISGYRNTEARVANMGLRNRLAGKSVLDIGCNAGFILASVSDVIDSGTGFDINPYLIDIAEAVAAHQGLSNLSFQKTCFEDYAEATQFDSILSLANHSTYDQNTKQSVESYFEKCLELLKPGGELIFESHPPQIEDEEKLAGSIAAIERFFEIEERTTYDFDGFLDKNRTYVYARKK